jgi:glucokinase
MRELYLGIEIGGTKVQIVAGDESLAIIDRWRGDVDRSKGAEGIRIQIAAALEKMLENTSPLAVGVGFGGPVNTQTGAIACSHQIGGWNDFALKEWLWRETGAPAVIVDNDANVGALGEAMSGAGKGPDPLFYVTLGSGVGGGLVVDGKIYHGAVPGECEFGHLRLDRSGSTLESRCSGWAIDARVRECVKREPHSILASLVGQRQSGEARFLAAALAQNDPGAIGIMKELGDDLAFALSHVVHLFHPRAVILGGGLALVGPPLPLAIQDRLPAYIMEAFKPGPALGLAALGEDSVPVGALHLARSASQIVEAE